VNSLRDVVAPSFEDYDRTQDSSHVSAALERVAAASYAASAGQLDRMPVLDAWLWFLIELDRRIEPDWDPADVPPHGVAPPAEHGPVFPSGEVDPDTIADPAERASYVARLQAARAAVAHHTAQAALRQIGRQALPLFADFIEATTAHAELEHRLAAMDPGAGWLASAALGDAPPGW
jgi:hypothetical protein